MFENSFTAKKYLLRPVRRCKSGCKHGRVAPALIGTSYEN